MKGTTRTILIALGVATILATVATGAAVADRGGRSRGESSISLVVLSAPTAEASGSVPHYGDPVTFDVSTTETAYPYVNLKCFQNGNLVAEGWAGFFDGALGTRTFGLYSPLWTGGAAECTAWLDMNSNGRWKQLASTSFRVDP